MSKKMLIDATHAEETRVVVIEGNKVDEFDFETITKRQIAGNIYLAKVTRVEPSLQAAFVDYGGNRHGFLAFSEIHPDYYQIPLEDRMKLIEEEEAYARSSNDDDADEPKPKRSRRRSKKSEEPKAEADAEPKPDDSSVTDTAPADDAEIADATEAEGVEATDDAPAEKPKRRRTRRKTTKAEKPETDDAADTSDGSDGEDAPSTKAESVGMSDPDNVVSSDDIEDEEPLLVETPEDEAAKEKPKPRRARRKSVKKADDAEAPVADTAEQDAAPAAEAAEQDAVSEPEEKPKRARRRRKSDDNDKPASKSNDAVGDENGIESVAAEAVEEEFVRKKAPSRRFKIQEVIRVRQILLVQVVKEERGNKGAALTTYLSLAGRYCVLMPNTARGGGISRKITNVADRKKLKEIANEIDVPQGAGLIIRTAGSRRTRTEIKRDYEYLLRLWEQIRELTLNSIAPKLIYEEGNLIKRSIRDLYSREIDEVLVAGDTGYNEAKEYMKMLLPSHAKNVTLYQDPMPLFARYQVENYLGGMMNPTVQLRSGGYIVIGITEALVAIDVNSGRATKEGSIEETALKTNSEAAEEIARQMRLRDLAGLIVIDFIDMEERRNNNSVEKRLKDALKNDRARIQVGRISGFGLLEMSRQRLRPGMLEATTSQCPHCYGTGYIRSEENLALAIMRELDEEGMRQRSKEVMVKVPLSIANYLLNAKREHIVTLEGRYGLSVRIEADPALVGSQYNFERFKTATRTVVQTTPSNAITAEASMLEANVVVETPEPAPEANQEANEDGGRKRKRRRRRRGRGGRDQANDQSNGQENADQPQAADTGETQVSEPSPDAVVADAAQEGAEEKPARKPRRVRKPKAQSDDVSQAQSEQMADAEGASEPEPKPKRTRRKAAEKPAEPAATEPTPEPVTAEEATAEEPKKKRAPRKAKAAEEPAKEVAAEPAKEVAAEPEKAEKDTPKEAKRRSGWWSRALGR